MSVEILEDTLHDKLLFCRHKPIWIVSPTVSNRNICMCTNCENIH